MAAMTKSSGGRVVAAEELPALFEELSRTADQWQVEIQTRWRLGDTPLDAWLLLLAFTAALAAEWALRKHWGLV